MTPLETVLTLQQLANIIILHKYYGKSIDAEMQECYNSCAFKEEVLAGSLRIFPPWLQKVHSSSFQKENQ